MCTQEDAVGIAGVDACDDVSSRQLRAVPDGDGACLLLNLSTKFFEAFHEVIAATTRSLATRNTRSELALLFDVEHGIARIESRTRRQSDSICDGTLAFGLSVARRKQDRSQT